MVSDGVGTMGAYVDQPNAARDESTEGANRVGKDAAYCVM